MIYIAAADQPAPNDQEKLTSALMNVLVYTDKPITIARAEKYTDTLAYSRHAISNELTLHENAASLICAYVLGSILQYRYKIYTIYTKCSI